jgi:hypothetical protein
MHVEPRERLRDRRFLAETSKLSKLFPLKHTLALFRRYRSTIRPLYGSLDTACYI